MIFLKFHNIGLFFQLLQASENWFLAFWRLNVFFFKVMWKTKQNAYARKGIVPVFFNILLGKNEKLDHNLMITKKAFLKEFWPHLHFF